MAKRDSRDILINRLRREYIGVGPLRERRADIISRWNSEKETVTAEEIQKLFSDVATNRVERAKDELINRLDRGSEDVHILREAIDSVGSWKGEVPARPSGADAEKFRQSVHQGVRTYVNGTLPKKLSGAIAKAGKGAVVEAAARELADSALRRR